MTQLVITQADREAAADLYERLCGTGAIAKYIRDNSLDEGPSVQAFAAHRQASTDYLVEALEAASNHFSGTFSEGGTVHKQIIAAIATARSHE